MLARKCNLRQYRFLPSKWPTGSVEGHKTKRRQVALSPSKVVPISTKFFSRRPNQFTTPCLVSFRILLRHFPIEIIIRDRPDTFYIVLVARVKNADIMFDVLF